MGRRFCPLAMVLALLALPSCDDDSGTTPADGSVPDVAQGDMMRVDGATDTAHVDGAPDGAPDGATNPCPRLPGPADAPRAVVVAHPYSTAGSKAPRFEVLQLSAAGKLSGSNLTFDLASRAIDGEIVFTPDGKVGLVVLEDGTVGVFTLDGAGNPTVVHMGLKLTGYASRVALSPDGQRAFILSSQWRNVGGGIYGAKINCDGTLTDEGLVAASKLPAALLHTASGQALVVARDVLSSKAGDDVHLLNLGSPWSVVAGADAFGDDEAIVSWAALTADGKYLLAADNNGVTAGNRVAVTQVLPGQLKPAQVLTSTTVIKDPTSIATSPYDNAAVVLGAMANQITVLDYTPGGNPPFSIRGPLATSSKPQLPVDTVMIRRGALKGRVLVSENLSIRQIQFEASGQVTEVELFKVGSGNAAIVGAIGVQP